jgi:hypothetical protein
VPVRTHNAAVRNSVLMLSLFCLLCAASAAQQDPSAKLPDAPSKTAQSQPAQQGGNPESTGGNVFSMLAKGSLMFPTLATDSGRLTPEKKLKLAIYNSVSLATIGGALLGSAYNQAINSPAGYGQGGEGYAKRFGADMARSSSANLIGNFAIASALHEDPRFYVKRNLTWKQSIKYCAVRVFATRDDDGKPTVNYAGLIGPLAAEGLATVYYPNGNNGVGDVFIRYSGDIGWTFGANLLRQYWPAINRKLHLAPTPTAPEPAKP